jgi:siroheme synthase-like protein
MVLRCRRERRCLRDVRPVSAASIESPVPVRHAYPIMLDVTDRLTVIVGGGAVAVRKASGVIEAGATRVRCVSPAFDAALPPAVERVEEMYQSNHLDGAGLAFAATDLPAVNDAVVRDARARGILVSRVDALEDEVERGDFITPARFNESGVIVSVSAGSPALGVLIRNGLAQRWDVRWSQMAEAMRALRPMILKLKDLHVRRRNALFRELATQEALNVLAAEGVEGLKAWLARRFPESDHG